MQMQSIVKSLVDFLSVPVFIINFMKHTVRPPVTISDLNSSPLLLYTIPGQKAIPFYNTLHLLGDYKNSK